MKYIQIPVIINKLDISPCIPHESGGTRLSWRLTVSRQPSAAYIRKWEAVRFNEVHTLRGTSGAITLPCDGIRLKSSTHRIHCRSAFGYKGVA